jgi:hypothetical protein
MSNGKKSRFTAFLVGVTVGVMASGLVAIATAINTAALG